MDVVDVSVLPSQTGRDAMELSSAQGMRWERWRARLVSGRPPAHAHARARARARARASATRAAADGKMKSVVCMLWAVGPSPEIAGGDWRLEQPW